MRDLHTNQRIANLSPHRRAVLEEQLKRLLQRQSPLSAASQIPQRDVSSPCPLSSAQQRLWLLDQLQPGGTAYTELSAMRLLGSLDMIILQRSLDEVVRRHEILRTTFATLDGAPV
jgi:hypothetical protein